MNQRVIIIHSTRKSLLKHLYNFFLNFLKYDTIIEKINSLDDLKKIYSDIKENKIKYFVFSNGSDFLDISIKQKILEINPNQKMLFSENAWLTWQDFLYLDFNGIGNNSLLFNSDLHDIFIPEKLKSFIGKKIIERTSVGKNVPYKNYILVPLQVDGDSKILIGSPYFKKVKEFVDYIIKITPPNYKILFKNHPDNKNKVEIPKRNNVIDITYSNFSKKSLIENSLFVAGINSTFLIESLFFNKKTVVFGLDVFSNKDIVIEGYNKSFDELFESKINTNKISLFLDHLISQQIPKIHIFEEFKKIVEDEEKINTFSCTL